MIKRKYHEHLRLPLRVDKQCNMQSKWALEGRKQCSIIYTCKISSSDLEALAMARGESTQESCSADEQINAHLQNI